ncbi:MAG: lmo0937 family membrane protein [Gemmatimonadaceae bacterium]
MPDDISLVVPGSDQQAARDDLWHRYPCFVFRISSTIDSVTPRFFTLCWRPRFSGGCAQLSALGFFGHIRNSALNKGADTMFAIVAVVLLIAWVMGFVVFHVAGGLIHLLLIIAVISFVWHFVTGRKTLT